MGMLSQQYPEVAQGINSNLGNSPFSPIDPQIPIYELKTNWLNQLNSSVPEDYLSKIEIMVVISLLQKQLLDLDFSAVEMMKKSATMAEMVSMFENALQSSSMMKMWGDSIVLGEGGGIKGWKLEGEFWVTDDWYA